MVIRMIVTFLVVSGNNLTVKDKIFVAIAWSPKATVQVLYTHVCTEQVLYTHVCHRYGDVDSPLALFTLLLSRSQSFIFTALPVG